MRKFTNLFLICAAATLVLFGVAAQTGTVSFASHGTRHAQATREPVATVKPAPAASQSTPPPSSGGDDGG